MTKKKKRIITYYILLLIRYKLDENHIPPKYTLKNLTDIKDKEYWYNALPKLRGILNELSFDRADFHDLLIGRSVTEWEVKSAFQDKDNSGVIIPISKSLQDRAIWSHRQFHNGIKYEEDMKKDFSDVTEIPTKKDT